MYLESKRDFSYILQLCGSNRSRNYEYMKCYLKLGDSLFANFLIYPHVNLLYNP